MKISESDYKVISNEVARTYVSIVWTHKEHEKQAEIYVRRYNVLKTVNIFTTAFTAADIVSILLKLISNNYQIQVQIIAAIFDDILLYYCVSAIF